MAAAPFEGARWQEPAGADPHGTGCTRGGARAGPTGARGLFLITVWRICKAKRVSAAFDGKGAAMNPGRWNTAGVPVVYTAESRSLASLEILVHVEDTNLLAAIRWVFIPVEIDESLIHVPKTLPKTWWRTPPSAATRKFGATWAKQARTPVLRVPSAVTRGEFNYLLNPRHPAFAELRFGKATSFTFDHRVL